MCFQLCQGHGHPREGHGVGLARVRAPVVQHQEGREGKVTRDMSEGTQNPHHP